MEKHFANQIIGEPPEDNHEIAPDMHDLMLIAPRERKAANSGGSKGKEDLTSGTEQVRGAVGNVTSGPKDLQTKASGTYAEDTEVDHTDLGYNGF